MCRLGHPARILPTVLGFTLDSQVKKSEEHKYIRDLEKQKGILQKKLSKTKVKYEKRKIRKEIGGIR